MAKIKYLKRINLFILIIVSLILYISSAPKKVKIVPEFHPMKIKYDFSNLKGGLSVGKKQILEEEIELAGKFISKMIYVKNRRNSFTFTEDDLKYCYDKSISFTLKSTDYENTDLLIIPLYSEQDRKQIINLSELSSWRNDFTEVYFLAW